MKTKATKKQTTKQFRTAASPTFRVVAQLDSLPPSNLSLNVPVTGSPVPVSDPGNRAVVVTDDLGQSTAKGNDCIAIAGFGGTATASLLAYVLGFSPSATPPGGLAYSGANGVAITAEGGAASAGDSGIAAALEGGNAIVQGRGVAIVKGSGAANVTGLDFIMDGASGVAIVINSAGNFDATAAAGQGGVLVIGYFNGKGKRAFSVAMVDGKKIESGKPYKVKDKSGKIIAA